MDVEKMTDSEGSSGTVEDILEETLGLTSESFDPLRVIYAPSLEIINDNVEGFKSGFSQFMKNVKSKVEVKEGLSHEETCPPLDVPSSSSLATQSQKNIQAEKSSKHELYEATEGQDFLPTAPAIADVDRNIAEESVNKELTAESMQAHVESESLGISEKSACKTKTSLQPSKKGLARPTVLTRMENGFQQGPLSILRRSVQEKMKVRVWTRSVRNIRGISTGYVVAFDKHMNLAMMDVDEVYRKPLGKHQRKRKKPKDGAASLAQTSETSTEAEVLYPNTPWQPLDRQPDTAALTAWVCDDSSDEDGGNFPADAIGNMTSQFKGINMFEETEATRLLGVKSRRALTRHLNQVLLRGENVVAVSLVELGL